MTAVYAALTAAIVVYLFLLFVVVPIGIAIEKIDAWRSRYIVGSDRR